MKKSKEIYLTSAMILFLAGCTATLNDVSRAKADKVEDNVLRGKNPLSFFWNGENRNIVFRIENNTVIPIYAKDGAVTYKENTYCLTTDYKFCNKRYKALTAGDFSARKHKNALSAAINTVIGTPFSILEDSLGVMSGNTNFSNTKTSVAGKKVVDDAVVKGIADKAIDGIMLEYERARNNPDNLASFVKKYNVLTRDSTLKKDLKVAYSRSSNSATKKTLSRYVDLYEVREKEKQELRARKAKAEEEAFVAAIKIGRNVLGMMFGGGSSSSSSSSYNNRALASCYAQCEKNYDDEKLCKGLERGMLNLVSPFASCSSKVSRAESDCRDRCVDKYR